MNQMQQEKELTENILKVVSIGIGYTVTFLGCIIFRACVYASSNLIYIKSWLALDVITFRLC